MFPGGNDTRSKECILLGKVVCGIALWLQSKPFAACVHWLKNLLSVWFAAKSDLPVIGTTDRIFTEIIGFGVFLIDFVALLRSREILQFYSNMEDLPYRTSAKSQKTTSAI